MIAANAYRLSRHKEIYQGTSETCTATRAKIGLAKCAGKCLGKNINSTSMCLIITNVCLLIFNSQILILSFTASKCNECGKMVANIEVHMRHHKSKKNNIPVECPICGKKIRKYLLLRHIRGVHNKQQPRSNKHLKVYGCNDCDEFFSKRQELRQHEYIKHTSDEKIYECSICGTVFRKLKLFNVHRFTHEPLNVKCETCNKVYARKAALYKHNRKYHPELINSRNPFIAVEEEI